MMEQNMTQEERLDYLVEEFKADSGTYRDLATPADASGKRQLLRSLMNIRMPRPMDPELLRVQDAYLAARSREKGVVQLEEIPTVRDDAEKPGRGGEAVRDAFADKASDPAAHISIWQGDITRLACDAIVNAANSQMLGCFQPCHSCIDNCIHTYAGVQLRAACEAEMAKLRARYGEDYLQPTAVPMLTDAYNLPAKKVIHIVGPIVQGNLTREHEADLATCYRSTLDMCREHGLKSVAFCCISTGVFMFPADRAARIAVETVQEWMRAHPGSMDRVIFNVFKDADLALYQELLG